MAIKIVVVDAAQLPDGVEFPPLATPKYGWEQYPRLQQDEIEDRCWRADILVSLGMPVDRAALEKLHRLKLVIAVGDACRTLDQVAARDKGIELLIFPNDNCADPSAAQDLCVRIGAAIDHYIDNSTA